MGISVKIAGVDRTEYVDAKSLGIIDQITSRSSSASFSFICNDVAITPKAGESVLIEEGATKLFSGRVLSKEEALLPPNQLTYEVECIDHTRDLDKKLVIESYLNQLGGNILKDIVAKYTTGFTTDNVADGPTVVKIAFDYLQVSEAITALAEACGYQWYVDYDKDIHFFLKTDYPASFQLDDDQEHYRDLTINTEVSQLRNRVYVRSSKYEILDFTELFIGDGATVTWTCKYAASPLPHPSLKLDGVAKTVGWDGVDDPDDYDFMLNATTKVLSLGTGEGTPADGAEIVITHGADVPIMIRWDDQASIDAIIAIEGGDGIFEFCITDNNIDNKEWAIDVAKADLLQNANPVIQGTFLTNKEDIRSGQIITVNSTKRNISQDFLVQEVSLVRVDTILGVQEEPEVPFKDAGDATIGFKDYTEAEVPFVDAEALEWIEYYVYEVTIATKLKGLEDLLLGLLYQSSESLMRDTIAPAVPIGLTLSTGMGEITQASLAWLKAVWDANTEEDLSHYELKYKKSSYSDFGLVSTTDTSFIWTGLEQNIEYQVYIRAVDIYGNRSAWSSIQAQVIATDVDVPDQITGAVATALLAGMKAVWAKSMSTNIAGYIVERQESNNGTTWTGAWTERVRITSTMWLDLLLPYVKYYRYRIKAYTQTGIEGAASAPTANSIKPNKAGADDIIFEAITGDHIAVNTIMANNYQELRNTYVQQGQDSLDGGYPFELDFEIVSEMTSINNIKLSFRIRKFRAYAKGIPSGGGKTSNSVGTPSGGGVTTSYTGTPSGGAQTSGAAGTPSGGGASSQSGGGQTTTSLSGMLSWRCGWNIFGFLVSTLSGARILTDASLSAMAVHSHYVYSHTHYIYAHTHPSHYHYVYAHTHPSHYHTTPPHTHPSHYHTVPNHAHTLTFGIYEEAQSPTINVYIDNGSGYGGSIGAYTTDKLDINITGYISGTGFKRIKFTSNKKTRISAWVLCKIDLSA